MLTTLTFLTAWIGYLSVTIAMLAYYARNGRVARWAVPAMVGVVSIHVLLVWYVRFGFNVHKASEIGILPAIMLHALYVLILVHSIGRSQNALAGKLIYPAWGLVTLLGTSSTFMMPLLYWLQVPMVLTLVGGIIGLVFIRRKRTPGVGRS